MNKLLKRQLTKLTLNQTTPPNQESWSQFVQLIDQSYNEYDEHLNRSQQTLEIAVSEMQNYYKGLEIRSIQNSKLAVLGELASTVAHEINNPLMVLNSIGFLLKKYHDEKQYELAPTKIDQMIETVQRINKIITGIRNFSRNGEVDPLISKSVSSIVNETFDLCIDSLTYNKISLKFENTVNEDVKINCRPVQLTQVLLNLINNSKDAIEKLPDRWIHLSLEKSGRHIILKITDSGLGISSDVIDQIFEPFFTTKDLGKGTGLGLSISKSIIESHGGKLGIDSSHKNTCFVIKLPVLDSL